MIDLTTPESGAIGLSTFFNMAREWHLTEEEQAVLLGVDCTQLSQWREQPVVSLETETIDRLSYLFGIYKALQILFPSSEDGAIWLHAPNDAPLFHGKSALDRMTAGQVSDLRVVRQYLDGQRYR